MMAWIPESNLDDVYHPLWHYAIVENVDDENDAGRIQVRIEGIDRKITLEGGGYNDVKTGTVKNELVWCEPLMPKYINILPRKGEMVRVAVFNYRNKFKRRLYIGPVVGQQTVEDFKNPKYSTTMNKVEYKSYGKSWTTEVDTKIENKDWSVWPSKDDISIIGRVNTDLILKDKNNYNEVILRAGKIDWTTLTDPTPKLNKVNPAYITVNHTLPRNATTSVEKSLGLDKNRTHINIVADKLNLISHLGSSVKAAAPSILTGDDPSQQYNTEITSLHPVIYGDLMWDFLSLLKEYVSSHVHPYDGLPPDPSLATLNLVNWFNKNMGNSVPKKTPDGNSTWTDYDGCTFLSKGVRTN